jgi:hypothetical protein
MTTLFAAALTAISVTAGVRCFDVRAADGGCLVAQQVAAVWSYGELHGALDAMDFPGGAGVVVGASFGGDVGTPFFRFRHDRLRLAARLTVDGALDVHGGSINSVGGTHIDFDAITFVAGPQLWVRISPAAFFVVRAAAGGSVFLFDLFDRSSLVVSPTVDAALGFAFDLF